MKKLFRLMPVVLLVLSFGVMSLQAQSAESIKYGDVVEGEMTASDYEFNYSFEGSEGDVLVINFAPVEEFGDLSDPIMILTNADGDTVSDTSETFVFGSLQLAAELPAAGSYNLLVTRKDGESGESVGEFTVEVINLPVLEVGSPLETEQVNSEQRPQYYAVKTDESWGLNYLKTDGTMEVKVSVNTFDTATGTLTEVAGVDGDLMTEVAVGIFDGGSTYIVSVGEPLFAFNFNEVETEYSLELLAFDN